MRLARGGSCEAVVGELNQSLTSPIDEKELVSILRTLNETDQQKLPPKYVTKNQARKMGWKPGRDLWGVRKLRGKSIGGDVFGNREGRLPDGKRVWHEADLDYKGGKRGPKRILYSTDGLRMVTVDHYRTFEEVPPCR
jgi:ribonuclease T1